MSVFGFEKDSSQRNKRVEDPSQPVIECTDFAGDVGGLVCSEQLGVLCSSNDGTPQRIGQDLPTSTQNHHSPAHLPEYRRGQGLSAVAVHWVSESPHWGKRLEVGRRRNLHRMGSHFRVAIGLSFLHRTP